MKLIKINEEILVQLSLFHLHVEELYLQGVPKKLFKDFYEKPDVFEL